MLGTDESPSPNPIPAIFKDNIRVQSAFEEIASALERDSSVFRDPDSASKLSSGVQAIAKFIGSYLLRGGDYFDESLSRDVLDWLVEHYHLSKLGYVAKKNKSGRLGGVVALHPRREELATILTPSIVDTMNSSSFAKVLPHASRLLTHTNAPACENFAFELLRHPESAASIPDNTQQIDAFIFYTYGPYVLEALQKQGRGYDDLMKLWLGKRHQSPKYSGNALYPGIEYMYEFPGSDLHYLKKDGNDPSHQFVKFITQKAIVPFLEITN